MTEDAQLLHQFAEERSESAFREFVARRIDFVYGAALRQVGGDAHLAQEVAQNVFLDLARKARALASRPTVTGWLYTSTRFAAAKALRSRMRRLNHETKAHAMNEILSASSAAEIDWNELRPVIDEAMHELGESDREAILLRFFEGRSLADVGAVLGLAENSARMRVERALEKLRGRLERRGITSTAAALGATLAAQPIVAAPAGLAVVVAGAQQGLWSMKPRLFRIARPGPVFAGAGALVLIGVLVVWPMRGRGKIAVAAVAERGAVRPGGLGRASATPSPQPAMNNASGRLAPDTAASAEEQRRKILFNLRTIAAARAMFVHFQSRTPGTLADLSRYLSKPNSVAGETYEGLDLAAERNFSVTTSSGTIVTLDVTKTGAGTPVPIAGRSQNVPAGLRAKVLGALGAWHKARGDGTGAMPRSAQELLAFFETTSDAADYLEWLESLNWPQR